MTLSSLFVLYVRTGMNKPVNRMSFLVRESETKQRTSYNLSLSFSPPTLQSQEMLKIRFQLTANLLGANC